MSEITEEQQEQDQEVGSPQEYPGKRLREARESAGLKLADIATQMRLNERMVKALEEDDYAVFPSATFVSGYLRSYARILGLPEEDFVKPVVENIEPPSLVSTVGSKAQVTSSDLPVRLVTWLLVIVIIVSVSMWWLSQQNKGQENTQQAQQEAVQSTGSMDLSVPEKSSKLSAPETADKTGTDPAPEAAASDSSSKAAAEQASEPADEEADSTPAVEKQTPSSSDKEADNEKTSPPLTASTPTSSLELRYQADSWTEVSDAAGRQLVYGLIKAGQDLKLKGEAPFKVFLGYAPGVTVYYNNGLFDHSPFQRRDVARFRVGRAEHNLPDSR